MDLSKNEPKLTLVMWLNYYLWPAQLSIVVYSQHIILSSSSVASTATTTIITTTTR
jgi:hypothetical protein